MLQAISESVETQPLLRLSLAVLTIGSLLSIAIVNLVGSGGWVGMAGPGEEPSCLCVLPGGTGEPVLDPGHLQVLESHSLLPESCIWCSSLQGPVGGLREAPEMGLGSFPFAFHTRTWGPQRAYVASPTRTGCLEPPVFLASPTFFILILLPGEALAYSL